MRRPFSKESLNGNFFLSICFICERNLNLSLIDRVRILVKIIIQFYPTITLNENQKPSDYFAFSF